MTGPARSTPAVLVAYSPGQDAASVPEPGAYAVVYVRPETNGVLYERAIAAAIRGRGEQVVYLANLGGALLRQDGVLQHHYATQLRFAEDPAREVARYPEIGRRLEQHFGAGTGRSLVGAFQAEARTGMGAQELFEAFVPQVDFLACWGQLFKRIGGVVVANPGLPEVLRRCGPDANVFVVAVRSPDLSPGFFASLNRAIYEEVCSRGETPLVDADRLGSVRWSERVRRTYHISRTPVMAMLDMADFVYLAGGGRLEVTETPLGRSLLAQGVLTAEKLRAIQRDPLQYSHLGGHRLLHYLPLAGEGRELDWVRQVLREL